MKIPFVKLQGNGNDFILIDEMKDTHIPDEMKGQFARLFCDRRFGIGGDGVLVLLTSDKCDVRMRLIQPDESEAEMCGNGIRCLVCYAYEAGYVGEECSVDTMAGTYHVTISPDTYENEYMFRINMTKPEFEREKIPATGYGEYEENLFGYKIYAVNTGVPHAVIFVDDVESLDLDEISPQIRNHESFPQGANVNFVELKDKKTLKIRTFERGVEGETLSCGTGATASAAVANKLGKVGDTIEVETLGGKLIIEFNEDVTLEGGARIVFFGEIRA